LLRCPLSSLSSRPPTVGTDVPRSSARTLGPSAVGSTATSGELRGNGGRNSTRSTLRSRAIASVGYRAEHAALARYLALVVNELLTAGARPSNGREAELGSPYTKYKGALAHFGFISTTSVGMQ